MNGISSLNSTRALHSVAGDALTSAAFGVERAAGLLGNTIGQAVSDAVVDLTRAGCEHAAQRVQEAVTRQLSGHQSSEQPSHATREPERAEQAFARFEQELRTHIAGVFPKHRNVAEGMIQNNFLQIAHAARGAANELQQQSEPSLRRLAHELHDCLGDEIDTCSLEARLQQVFVCVTTSMSDGISESLGRAAKATERLASFGMRRA